MCQACLELCPEVFRINPAGYLEIVELADYPVVEIDEAIAACPAYCVSWREE